MKTKTYDINFLIVAILLFLLAFCFGCKDKADITFGVNHNWRPPNYICSIHGETDYCYTVDNIEYCNECVGKFMTECFEKGGVQRVIIKSAPESGTFSFDGDDYIEANSADFTEPNEPETTNWIYIADLNEPKKVSLDFILTWPDYIELEKDLIIDMPRTMWLGDGVRMKDFLFPKGTKIYFKED